MNYLKIKFGLFSLLAVLAVSVFLTSCEQDSVILENPLNVESVEMEIPPGIESEIPAEVQSEYYIKSPDNLNKEEAAEWVKSLSEDQLKKMTLPKLEVEYRDCTPWEFWFTSGYQDCINCQTSWTSPSYPAAYFVFDYELRRCNGTWYWRATHTYTYCLFECY